MHTVTLTGSLIPEHWLSSPEVQSALHASPVFQWLAQQHCSLLESVTQENLLAPCSAHQAWLGNQLGLIQPCNVMGALAAVDLTTVDLATNIDLKHWWRIEPVHYRLATDHIVLAQAGFSDLNRDDANELVTSLAALCDHFALSMTIADSGRWYLQWAAQGLTTATSLAATGRNIDIYLPQNIEKNVEKSKKDDARLWRRIATEIEMTWFNHAVNQRRQHAGKLAINSVWLESACSLAVCPANKTNVFSNDVGNRALLNGAGLRVSQAFEPQHPTLIEYHDLNRARLEASAWDWIQAWQALQQPLLAHMQAAQDSPHGLELVCFGERQRKAWHIKPKTTWQKLSRSGKSFAIRDWSEPLQ